MGKTKSQVSMEYLVIFSIAVAMSLPLVIIFVTQTDNIKADIAQSEIQKAAFKIVDYAETVYFIGYPSQKTLIIEFPVGINSVTFDSYTNTSGYVYHSLSINATTGNHNYLITQDTVANITGSIRPHQRHIGIHLLIISFQINCLIHNYP